MSALDTMSVAQFVHFAEGRLHEALVAAEQGDSEEARNILVRLFYDLDRWLLPGPYIEEEERLRNRPTQLDEDRAT